MRTHENNHAGDWREYETLQGRLKARMDELGYSQAQLSRKANVSTGLISDLLSGKRGRRMGIAISFRLKKALGVPSAFFDLENPHMRNRKSEQSNHA